ncbi:MAG: hypothetical protein ACOYKB_04300 [Succiniclasticum sp.]|jgi:hypothetical protein
MSRRLIGGLLGLALAVPVFAAAAPVTQVQVHITDTHGTTSRPLLDKMSGSMRVVAEQLFNGRDSAAIAADASDYEHLLSEISDRVITGYQTNRVSLRVVDTARGTTAVADFSVSPWAETVRTTKVDLQFSGIDAETAALLENKLPGLRQQLQHTLEGASLDAADWAGSIVRAQVQKQVETALPDFKAAVDLTTRGGDAFVQVIIYPVGPVVRDVRYSMASKSIPNILLMGIKYRYADKAKALRGLPLGYLRTHRDELEARFLAELQAEPEVRRYHLTPGLMIDTAGGGDAVVDITLESQEYKIWFEGYGDIGRDDHNLSGKAHLGKYVSPQAELFGEVSVDLDDVDWTFDPGFAYHRGKATVALMRRLPDDKNIYRATYDFTPKWRLRLEHFGDTGDNEYAVRYRIHEFLSGEYVISSDKSYFRIVGNL